MAKAVFAHYTLKKKFIEKVVEIVREECALMCGRSRTPLFRRLPVDKAEGFSFTDCISELERMFPTLLRLLTSVVTANDARNAKTRVKFRKKSIHHYPGICTAAAILLKERNRELCGVQTHIALVLYHSNVKKKVIVPVINNNIKSSKHPYTSMHVHAHIHVGIDQAKSPWSHYQLQSTPEGSGCSQQAS